MFRFSARLIVIAIVAAPAVIAHAHPDDPKERDYEPPYVRPTGAGLRGTFTENFDSNGITLQSWLTVGELSAVANGGADCWGHVSGSGREYAIVGLTNCVTFVDMTNPTSPFVVGHVPGVLSTWRDIKVFQDHAYIVSEGSFGKNNGGGIQVIDMTNIDSAGITLVNTISDATDDDTHNIALDPDSGYAYRCGGRALGLRAYDLSVPSAPVLVGQWNDRYVHDAQIVTYTDGPYAGREIAFCCSGVGTGGGGDPAFDILDVTTKGMIKTLAQIHYPQPGYSHQVWISPDRKYAYLNDELDEDGALSTTTHVIDIADLKSPVAMPAFANTSTSIGHNLYVAGGMIFEANYRSGLRVFSATDPQNPKEVAYFDSYPNSDSASFTGMWSNYPYFPSGNIVCSDINRGFFSVRLDVLNFSYPNGFPESLTPFVAQPIAVQFNRPGADVDPATVMLHVRVDGGSPTSALMSDLGGGLFSGDLPGAPCGSNVEYYVSADSLDGGSFNDPPDAPTVWREVGAIWDTITLVALDFESPSGWTGGVAGDTASSGQWQRAVPQFTAAQPDHDRTAGAGVNCWVTRASAGASVGDFDIDNGKTTLLSAVYDLSANPAAEISYWRWYANTVTTSPGDDVFRVDITSDGSTWVNVETIGPGGQVARGGWAKHAFRVGDFVNPSATVRVRFIAEDANPGGIVEAAIDEFAITQPSCVTIPGDFDGDGDADLDDFAVLVDCTNGPNVAPAPVGVTPQECLDAFDTDADGDVDLGDFDGTQPLFGS